MDPRIREIEEEYERSDVPAFEPGDTVRVRVRVTEGDKERLQAFEGVCIARRGSGTNETFTVRRVTGGVAVERIFPVHSPSIASVEVVRRGQVRRAKLYYLRGRRGKRARVRERRWWLDAEEAVKAELAEGEAAEAAAGGEGDTAGETEGAEAAGETESAAEGPEASAEAGGAKAEASAAEAGDAEPEQAPEGAPGEAAEPAAEKE